MQHKYGLIDTLCMHEYNLYVHPSRFRIRLIFHRFNDAYTSPKFVRTSPSVTSFFRLISKSSFPFNFPPADFASCTHTPQPSFPPGRVHPSPPPPRFQHTYTYVCTRMHLAINEKEKLTCLTSCILYPRRPPFYVGIRVLSRLRRTYYSLCPRGVFVRR